ncbi:MAG: DUF5668 domain-containing protein [Candidatus Zixiibacteriota bacterium]
MTGTREKAPKVKRAPVTGGVILTGIGLVFLLSNFGVIPNIGRSWPLILIVVGVALLAGALTECRPKNSSSVPPGV